MKNLILGFTIAVFSTGAVAGWHNTSGTVSSINNYASTDTVLVRLSADGFDVTACGSKEYFAIDGALPETRRSQMYSALLAAKVTGKRVTIAYDDTGNCIAYGSNSNAYRGILRVIH